MQSTRHDPSLAALQAGAGLPGHVLDVVVLTSDPGVLATLREAAGPEHAIWHAPSADTAVDLLVGGRCSILIADLGALRGDAAALLDRLHAQFPELILMATGRRDEEHSVAMLVSERRIYRFLHKPVSPARANLFLSAATRRYNELRNVEPVHMTTAKQIATQPRSSAIVVSIAFLLIVAAAVAVWFMTREEPAPVAPPPRQAGTFTQEEQIADYLARGQMAIVTDRLIDPRGNNAVEYFRSVLALQPDNADALAGLQRVGAALEVDVVEALKAQSPARGATALATLQRAVPDYPRLDALRAELLALSRSSRTPISAAPPPAPVRQTAGPHACAEASRASADRGSTDASTGSPGPRESRSRLQQRGPAQASSMPSRACAVGEFCSNRRAQMPMSSCWRCARSIRTRTKFAPSSSNSHPRSWNARALRSRPATSTRRARS